MAPRRVFPAVRERIPRAGRVGRVSEQLQFAMPPPEPPAPSLSEALAARGYTHRPAAVGMYRRDIIDGRGVVVYSGTASEVWDWLADAERSDPLPW